ncbi:MAG: hypothetical protein C4581_12490 [Nitrospiraceae bacterium]|nr:MAG: hypothetical protein C4581_12490 [Nitrospiraceae bacterium]
MKMVNSYFLIVLLLFGCASSFVKITRETNLITLNDVQFTAPDTGDWYIRYPGAKKDEAVLTKQLDQASIIIVVARNDIVDPQLKSKSAKEVADDFRNHEKQIMIEQGVNKGLYTIKDLQMGEIDIQGQIFYTMDYVNVAKISKVRASLYLLFPSTAQNDYFIMTLFQEATPINVEIPDHKPVAVELLKSLTFVKH